MFIGHYTLCIGSDMLIDELAEGVAVHPLDMPQAKFAAALDGSHHNLFLLLPVGVTFALLFSANVSFVNFNDTAELRYLALSHRFADAVIQIPCGFVSTNT